MNNATILIIDDESQIRKLLEITLESNDFNTIFAVNAKEGLLLAANHPPQGMPCRSAPAIGASAG